MVSVKPSLGIFHNRIFQSSHPDKIKCLVMKNLTQLIHQSINYSIILIFKIELLLHYFELLDFILLYIVIIASIKGVCY